MIADPGVAAMLQGSRLPPVILGAGAGARLALARTGGARRATANACNWLLAVGADGLPASSFGAVGLAPEQAATRQLESSGKSMAMAVVRMRAPVVC